MLQLLVDKFWTTEGILAVHSTGMEEQFVLRVPPSVAERIESLLNENGSSSDDKSLDLSFSGKIMSA